MNGNGKLTGPTTNVLHVAIVGAGPAGFHAAIALLEQSAQAVEVDLFDRLPTPYGLVRAGVAPDHQKIKSVTRVYERWGNDLRFEFFGNVQLGRDIEVSDLKTFYDQVLYATGNENDRRLGVRGEHLEGCSPASVFVGWYNGHPDYRDAKFNLSSERVAIIGNGNVAVDVARILAKSPAELRSTDIADHALTALLASQVREVVVIGRRGPVQATFTPSELRELLETPGVTAHANPDELILTERDRAYLDGASDKDPAKRSYELLSSIAQSAPPKAPRRIQFRFLWSPVELVGDGAGHLQQLRLERNRLVADKHGHLQAIGTGQVESLDVGAVFVSIGYAGKRIAGVPFDEKHGTIANVDGRVLEPESQAMRPREYCTGWARTGARGLIATQKAGSAEVVARMLADYRAAQPCAEARAGRSAIKAQLEKRQVRAVSSADWRTLDAIEVQRGQPHGALRSKIVDIPEMIDLVELKRRGW